MFLQPQSLALHLANWAFRVDNDLINGAYLFLNIAAKGLHQIGLPRCHRLKLLVNLIGQSKAVDFSQEERVVLIDDLLG